MNADLEILARELIEMAEDGVLPNGEVISYAGVTTWAEGWLLSLAELGIRPAPASSRTENS